jgi:hypothetical protein
VRCPLSAVHKIATISGQVVGFVGIRFIHSTPKICAHGFVWQLDHENQTQSHSLPTQPRNRRNAFPNVLEQPSVAEIIAVSAANAFTLPELSLKKLGMILRVISTGQR